MTNIKGLAVQARLSYLTETFGKDGLARVLQALPAQYRSIVEAGVLMTEWYPLELSAQLLEVAERVLGRGDGALCHQIGMASSRRALSSVHRVFTDGAETEAISERMVRTTGLLWRANYDRGGFETRPLGAGAIESEMLDVDVRTPWLCHVLSGYLTGHIEHMGGRDVQVQHTECRARGDARCIWRSSWS